MVSLEHREVPLGPRASRSSRPALRSPGSRTPAPQKACRRSSSNCSFSSDVELCDERGIVRRVARRRACIRARRGSRARRRRPRRLVLVDTGAGQPDEIQVGGLRRARPSCAPRLASASEAHRVDRHPDAPRDRTSAPRSLTSRKAPSDRSSSTVRKPTRPRSTTCPVDLEIHVVERLWHHGCGATSARPRRHSRMPLNDEVAVALASASMHPLAVADDERGAPDVVGHPVTTSSTCTSPSSTFAAT